MLMSCLSCVTSLCDHDLPPSLQHLKMDTVRGILLLQVCTEINSLLVGSASFAFEVLGLGLGDTKDPVQGLSRMKACLGAYCAEFVF